MAIVSSLAKKTRSSSAVDTSRIYSNERSGENKYSSGLEPSTKPRRGNEVGPLYDGHR